MRRDRQPPGSLLVALLGALAGAAIGLVAYGIVWATQRGGGDMQAFLATMGSPGEAPLMGYLVVAGGLLGFLAVGSLVHNRLARNLASLAVRLTVVGLGGGVGAAVGTLAYIGVSLGQGTGSVDAAISRLPRAFANPADPLRAFVLAGVLAGMLGGVYLVGRRSARVAARVVVGAVLGGLTGLVIYCTAYVIVAYPALPSEPAHVFRFAQAVYSFTAVEFLFIGVASFAGAVLSRYQWRMYGILTFVALLFVIMGYVFYSWTHTLPDVPPGQLWLSGLLFAFELMSLLMVLLYSFYTIDVAARKHWRRTTHEAHFSPYYLPKVAMHLPCYNEPADMVIQTLRTLLAIDYPRDRLVIMVGDDSTRPECSGPLKEFCEANGIVYVHREDRRGYKAGALNVLLAKTPSDANLLAVIDADYHVESSFLRETVGYFIDPDLGWLQTPQDYRNRNQSFLTEQYYLADSYFYRTILPSRNEENSIIFCGTMGMLRKRAVVEVGGWGEKYITEDSELSVRLLNTGWKSLYINRTYGRGLIPPTFEAYKRQHYRWAFGGGKILRGHVWRFLFGRYTFRQRLDLLVGTLNWFEGAFLFAIALFVMAMGIGDIMGSDVVTHHSGEILLVGLVPLFLLLDGLTRVHLVLRRSINLGFGGTLRILGMWFAVKFSNMRAAIKAAIGFTMPFVRTPKSPSERLTPMRALALSLRLTRFESTMAGLLAATAIGVGLRMLAPGEPTAAATGRMLLVFWLAYYTLVFLAAPVYAYKSFSTLRPEGEVAFVEKKPKDVTA